MRRTLSFDCAGSTLWATLDEAAGTTGLLIVSGGNDIRSGAHRGMAQLAADMAAQGWPVFRFDRRGVGDSEGTNGGFETSGPDIEAAIAAFRRECPALTRIIAFGNCDAAAALLLHRPEWLDGLVLANIWTIEEASDLPPPSAIKARYVEKLKDPRQWLRLLSGGVNLRKLAGGLLKLARPAPVSTPQSLPARLAERLASTLIPTTILLAKGDTTAIAFKAHWESSAWAAARANPLITLVELDSASHSFASEADYAALKGTLLQALSL